MPKTIIRRFTRLAPVFWALVLLAGTVGQGLADHVITKGKLSNLDFYRLVACGALPGGPCQYKMVKWPPRKRAALTIAITRVDGGFPVKNVTKARAALQNAISEINAAGAGVRLVPVAAGTPDIAVHLAEAPISSTRRPSSIEDRFELGGAIAQAQVFGPLQSGVIERARVTITREVEGRDMKPVMLEEVVQSLGLLTDIHNRYYRTRSIFSETGSGVSRLRGQDAVALRYHYPP